MTYERDTIKLTAVIDGNTVNMTVKLQHNKPLIAVDEASLNSNVLIEDGVINAGFTAPAKIAYTLSVSHDGKGELGAWDDTVQNGGTYVSQFTRAPHDLLYIPYLKQFISIPNIHYGVVNHGHTFEVEGFSIGGKTVSTGEHVNGYSLISNTASVYNDIITLGDISGLSFRTKVVTIPGCVKRTDIDPNMHTVYLEGGIGEIMIGNSTPVYAMFIDVGGAFTEDFYPMSVMYPKSMHRYGLGHYERLDKPTTFMVILG